MGGALLNLVASGELNKIVNGNPDKTFFKATYAKYRNFGLQRFRIPFKEKRGLAIYSDSEFIFEIPDYGDMLTDVFFSLKLPDIYSPIYCPALAVQDSSFNKQELRFINRGLKGLYCQPYEFKWIKELGAQLIKKVEYKIDGRTIQEFSGHYIATHINRDMSKGKIDLYNEMIGNISELNDPANAYDRNGNYPSSSWNTSAIEDSDIGELLQTSAEFWGKGLAPSIPGRILYIPIHIWGESHAYLSLPLVALYYSKLTVHVHCRPVSEICVIRDINYLHDWLQDCSGMMIADTDILFRYRKPKTTPLDGIPNDMNKIFTYYNPPFIRPNFSDPRSLIDYFIQPPPLTVRGTLSMPMGSFLSHTDQFFPLGIFSNNIYMMGNGCLGEFAYNKDKINIMDAWVNMAKLYYTKDSASTVLTEEAEISLYTTYAFLGQDEIRNIAGLPQSYLVKEVVEQTFQNIQGTQRINVNSTGMTAGWMWFFQRTDVPLRNEWSNYTNWLYENQMPYPCVLSLDLSFTLQSLYQIEQPYITPCYPVCPTQYNICSMYITGPVHPGNEKDIMVDWGLFCNEQERETIFPSGIPDLIEKYIRTPGNNKDGLYIYNFYLDENEYSQPAGAMNMRKFTDVAFEYTTIDPFREVVGGIDDNYPVFNSFDVSSNLGLYSREPIFGLENIEPNKCNSDTPYGKYAINSDTEPGGTVWGYDNPSYKNYNYNYNLHVMEERYNIITFSNGMASLSF